MWYDPHVFMIDLHTHILPGLDDGAPDMQVALAMARMAAEDGVRAVCATPHAGLDPYYTTPAVIHEALGKLRQQIERYAIDLTLFPGSEVSVTADLNAMAGSDELLTLNESRYLLAELPFYGGIEGVEQQIFQISVSGYRVVLAHPERAQACQNDPGLLETLRYRGCLAQINVGSIIGSEGRRVRRMCRQWLEDGLVDVIASDAHNARRRRPVLTPAKEAVVEIGGPELWQTLTVVNPALILKDEDIP
ncbi:MAG: CpsB/CapC family capsule biosynthesis tyrosine phosphatase [Armatimonadota bacterium]